MRRKGSLRHRIIWTYALLTVVVCGFFAAVALSTLRAVEQRLIDGRLAAQAEWLIERHRRGLSTDLPSGTRFYYGAAIPADIRPLPAGLHKLNVGKHPASADARGRAAPGPTFGQHSVYVLAGTDRGNRFAVVDEYSDFQHTEGIVLWALGIGFGASVFLAFMFGRMAANRVVAPVTALADAVRRNVPQNELPSLAGADEIGVLARAFAARTAELERFLVRERLFAADVSHELRTPLTVILGAAELLALRAADRAELAAIAERIRRTAVDTTERVSAILLLSRAPERLDAPRIALTPLIERERERCEPLLAGKPVAFRLEAAGETWVHARPELAAIAIGNLLRNALQYTERGEVTVRLNGDALMVEDTGPGVPESVRARLFERFVRGAEIPSSGTGLGLAIVRRVAEHLGWGVRLEDRPTGGSRFILTFASPADEALARA